MESWMAMRRHEIECDLLQLEVQVWADLEREQQAKVDDEQTKMDELTDAAARVRAEFFVESANITKMVKSASIEHRRYRQTNKETRENSQQTDSNQQLIETEIQWDKVKSLRLEVQALQHSATLQAEHKLLSDEPHCGESFRSLRDACKLEKDRLAALDKKIASLELGVQSAERVGAVAGAAGDAAFEDFAWTATPWDELTAEDEAGVPSAPAAAAAARPKALSVVSEASEPRVNRAWPPRPPAVQHVGMPPTAASHLGALRPSGPPRPPMRPLPRTPLPGYASAARPQGAPWLARPVRPRPAPPTGPRGLSTAPRRGTAPGGGGRPVQRTDGEGDDVALLAWPSSQSQPSLPPAQSQGRFVPKKALIFKRQ